MASGGSGLLTVQKAFTDIRVAVTANKKEFDAYKVAAANDLSGTYDVLKADLGSTYDSLKADLSGNYDELHDLSVHHKDDLSGALAEAVTAADQARQALKDDLSGALASAVAAADQARGDLSGALVATKTALEDDLSGVKSAAASARKALEDDLSGALVSGLAAAGRARGDLSGALAGALVSAVAAADQARTDLSGALAGYISHVESTAASGRSGLSTDIVNAENRVLQNAKAHTDAKIATANTTLATQASAIEKNKGDIKLNNDAIVANLATFNSEKNATAKARKELSDEILQHYNHFEAADHHIIRDLSGTYQVLSADLDTVKENAKASREAIAADLAELTQTLELMQDFSGFATIVLIAQNDARIKKQREELNQQFQDISGNQYAISQLIEQVQQITPVAAFKTKVDRLDQEVFAMDRPREEGGVDDNIPGGLTERDKSKFIKLVSDPTHAPRAVDLPDPTA